MLVEIPRGIPGTDGKWLTKTMIRHINGHDEQSVLEIPQDLPHHQRVLFLLERIVRFQGVQDIETGEVLRKICIGDRVALLLHARSMILGDRIPCTITCTKCEKKMSADLNVSNLLQVKYPAQRDTYEVEIGGHDMKIKPLNAFSQDEVLDESASSPNSLEQKLAKSCIAYSKPELPTVLPTAILNGLGSKLEEIDPLSDIVLDISCPACGYLVQALFPAEEFIFKEFAMHYNQLEREVHWIAFNYCWSENDILDLPVTRRKKYIELINSTLSGEST